MTHSLQDRPDRKAGTPFEDRHRSRLDWLERAEAPIVALTTRYPHGQHVPAHRHSRAQLLYALSGVATVSTALGRWMVPPGHGIFIPADTDHAVDMAGDVDMYSLYVTPGSLAGLPVVLRVVGMTPLMRSLIVEAVGLPEDYAADSRAGHLMALILHEIPRLEERPLALPIPASPRMAALCHAFLRAPSPHVTIDDFAAALGMSRRTFTRAFYRETGLSLARWRQQACLFAALPRLSGGAPVTTVALDLGYESVPAFTTMFRRLVGISPRQHALQAGRAREPLNK